MKLKPRGEAIAYRIWATARKVGWNITVRQAAEQIGEPESVVRMIVQKKGWLSRFRVSVGKNHAAEDMGELVFD